MDFVKFWELVEKHPWLVWVVMFEGNMQEDVISLDPEVLGYRFMPSIIGKEIDDIVFHPWAKLDLEGRPTQVARKTNDKDSATDLSCTVTYHCYWHLEGKPHVEGRFSRLITSLKDAGKFKEETQTGELTVGGMVSIAGKKNGTIDVIVKTTFHVAERHKKSGDLLEAMVNKINEEVVNIRHIEIYLPTG